MKKLIGLMTIIFLIVNFLLIISCAKREVIPGYVGEPIHLAAKISSPSDTVGCTFKWSFVSKPEDSNLDVLSFQPTSRNFNIYFVPDAPGEYVVENIIYDPTGKEKKKDTFICQVIEATPTEEAPETVTAEPVIPEEELPMVEEEVEEAPAAKVIYEEKPAPEKKERIVAKGIPIVSGKYTIQLSSWKTYNGAKKALDEVKKNGIDAYIQKAYIPELGGIWYRVRTGSFSTYSEAKQSLKQLQNLLDCKDLWIDFMRKDYSE